MDNADTEFKELMFEIGMNYSKKLNEDERKFFAMQARRFGFKKFSAAIRKHMEDPDKGQFMPKIADVVANIGGTAKQKSAEIEFTAQSQWQMSVMRAIKECGSYKTPKFTDPITTACIIAAGGWSKLCGLTTDQLIWAGKEFVNTYENYSVRPLDQLPANIAGREDIQRLKAETQGGMTTILATLENLKVNK
tara:strand:+ start:133 stop:708 length:576 start_codon:yes stop_codon:yes gene_type:complete